MVDLEEQHISMKFFFWLGKNATETLEMLKVVFGEKKMGRTQSFGVVFQVHEWHVTCWGWWSPSHQWRKQMTCRLSEGYCFVVAWQHYTTCYLFDCWNDQGHLFWVSPSSCILARPFYLWVSYPGATEEGCWWKYSLFWLKIARGSACSGNMGMSESIWKQAFWILLCCLCC